MQSMALMCKKVNNKSKLGLLEPSDVLELES